MIYAQVKNGIVANVIVLDETTDSSPFKKGFDSIVRVDTLPDRPAIGWAYDGAVFIAPPPAPVDPAVLAKKQQIDSAVETLKSLKGKKNKSSNDLDAAVDALITLSVN